MRKIGCFDSASLGVMPWYWSEFTVIWVLSDFHALLAALVPSWRIIRGGLPLLGGDPPRLSALKYLAPCGSWTPFVDAICWMRLSSFSSVPEYGRPVITSSVVGSWRGRAWSCPRVSLTCLTSVLFFLVSVFKAAIAARASASDFFTVSSWACRSCTMVTRLVTAVVRVSIPVT